MRSNKIISEYSKLEFIQTIAREHFTGLEFPEAVFCKQEWGVYCLESWNIFSDSTFKNFKNFLNEIEEKSIFLIPDSFGQTNIEEYIFSLEVKGFQKSEYRAVLEFNTNFDFKAFNNFQEHYFYHNLDSLLIGSSTKWGLYVNTNINLIILGFNPDIKKIIDKFYKISEERITSLDSVIDYVDIWAKKDKADEVKRMIIKNYHKAFDH